MLPGSLSVSGSAQAQGVANLNTSRSNIYRAKVTLVSAKAKTFKVIADGKEFTFNFPKQGPLPKVGNILDITYTERPGGKSLELIAVSDSNAVTRPPPMVLPK
jgi:hypothetical protein